MSNIYAIYRGDDFVTVGTSKEIMKELNISRKTLWFYTTPAYKKRCENSKKKIIAIKLEDKEEE